MIKVYSLEKKIEYNQYSLQQNYQQNTKETQRDRFTVP